jgi:phage terminase large subunit-like protein
LRLGDKRTLQGRTFVAFIKKNKKIKFAAALTRYELLFDWPKSQPAPEWRN